MNRTDQVGRQGKHCCCLWYMYNGDLREAVSFGRSDSQHPVLDRVTPSTLC